MNLPAMYSILAKVQFQLREKVELQVIKYRFQWWCGNQWILLQIFWEYFFYKFLEGFVCVWYLHDVC